jgi:predicted O-methyltransferase YrrM
MPTHDAQSILALGRAFMECRILLSAAELDLFTLLSRQPMTAAEVTRRLNGDERAMTILLDALAGIRLLTKQNGRYGCTDQIAALLSADAPQSVLPMVLHAASLWPSWSELTGIARGDQMAFDRAHEPRGEQHQRAFIGAMHVVASPAAPAIVSAIDPGPARSLLDVGGASGTYVMAFLNAFPQLRATLFDLPPVIEMARERLSAAGMLERVELVGGDFYADELPGGHDLALLSAIIHQNSPRQNAELYEKVWRALVPGGRLVIRDHVMSPDRTQPARGAVFAVNMLVRTAGGNAYTFEDIRSALVQAGFERVRLLQESSDRMDGLVEAFRPQA